MKMTDLTECIRLVYDHGLREGEWLVRVSIRPAPWSEFCAVQIVARGSDPDAVLRTYENMGGK